MRLTNSPHANDAQSFDSHVHELLLKFLNNRLQAHNVVRHLLLVLSSCLDPDLQGFPVLSRPGPVFPRLQPLPHFLDAILRARTIVQQLVVRPEIEI